MISATPSSADTISALIGRTPQNSPARSTPSSPTAEYQDRKPNTVTPSMPVNTAIPIA